MMAYSDPSPDDMKARYPAFSDVDTATVQYWIDDSARFVDQSWSDTDYAPAKLAAAAHNMLRAGVSGIAGADTAGMTSTGVTQFRSGSFAAQFSDEAVKKAIDGGWESTVYGQDYLALLRRNKSGMGTTSPGCIPASCGFNGYAGPLPPWNC